MAAEYDTFVNTLDELKQGEEIELKVRDTATFETRIVKAIISSTKSKLPDGDVLWIRFSRGLLHKEPWAIKIIADLGDGISS